MKRINFALLLPLLIFMVGCGGGSPPPPIVTMSIIPSVIALQSGRVQKFIAKVVGAMAASISWSASAGSIDANGLFTAPQVASATAVAVTANDAAHGLKAVANVTVVPPLSIQAVDASGNPIPAPYQVLSGAQMQFKAQGGF